MIKEISMLCGQCYWCDTENDQCFDGHLQYPDKDKCEGFTPCKFLNAESSHYLDNLRRD